MYVTRKSQRIALAVAVAVFCGLVSISRGELVWDSELGWIDMRERPAQSDRGLYAYATGLFVRGDYAAARDAFERVETQFPKSPYAAQSKFNRARCEARLGGHLNAARICAELLQDRPDSVRMETVAAFQLQEIRSMSPAHLDRSAELLSSLGLQAPTRELQYETQIEQGDTALRQARYDEARTFYEKAGKTAPDAESRDIALYKLGLADLVASRDGSHNETRLRRSESRFREYLAAASRSSERRTAAQEYVWLIENILNERDIGRREVYYRAVSACETDCKGGYSFFKKASNRYANSPAGETAMFYHAECLFHERKVWDAYEIYEKFVKQYSASARMRNVVEREFAIGQALAERGGWLDRDRAIGVMEAVVHNSPSGALAVDAEIYIGKAHLETEEFDEARASFDTVVEGYPRSPWNATAIYLGGVADARHADFAKDATVILARARQSFESYLRVTPNGQFAAEAQRLLAQVKERQAQDLMATARWYEGRRHPKAAAVYFAAVVKEHPGSAAAADAKTALERGAEQGTKAP